MPSLHILNRPTRHPAAHDCLTALQPGDTLLLIEEAVQDLLSAHSPLWALSDVTLIALTPDLQARGITPYRPLKEVDYAGFVNLTTINAPVISWY
jgi:tRNA 2-thiouridine synthesizing protein B